MDGAHILIADHDETIRAAWAAELGGAGHRVDTAADAAEVLEKIPATPFDLLLLDASLPPTGGILLVQEAKRLRAATLVAIAGTASVDSVLASFRAGAFDFLERPVAPEQLREIASRALSLRELGERRRRIAEELEQERQRVVELKRQLTPEDPFRNIVGSSWLVRNLLDTLREVARTDSTVLLTGESGTGKGLLARALHDASSRCQGPFVEANCVVYSEGVLHSELFGHERGAFTGAARLKRGRFELASGGTLFLDEIGEISPATQLLLLRVLQERNFERVGGEDTVEVNVRLIAATNRDLQEAMQRGAFRSDLFYRLNVIPIHLPPLREHPEDIPVLAQHFVTRCAGRMGRPVNGFTAETLEALVHYRWPGNIRELENLVERMVVLSRGERIGVQDLPSGLREGIEASKDGAPGTLQDLERRRILEVLRDARGNKKLAAKRLGIHRSTLYAKMRRYGLMEEPSASPETCPEDEQEVAVGTTLIPTS